MRKIKGRWRSRVAALTAVPLLTAGAAVAVTVPAQAATCTVSGDTNTSPNQCGPYTDANIYAGSAGSDIVTQNDVWSPPAGYTNQLCQSGSATPCETLSSDGPESWSVTANLPNNSGAVESYPDVSQYYTLADNTPDPITNYTNLYSTFTDTPAGGTGNSYDVGYDIWGGSVSAGANGNYADEIMIWTSQQNRGGCGGASPTLTGVQFGGSNGVPVQSWNLYNYGSERIWCSTSIDETSSSVDVYGMLHYLMAPGYNGTGSLPSDFGLNAIQYGVENCYTNGYDTFSLSKFTIAKGTGSSQQAPAATTNAATSITTSGATLNGSVNPEGADTTYKFDYGTSTSYGSSVPSPAADIGSGTSALSESQTLTGLSAGTLYHYRVEATNSGGTTFGSDQTFTTAGGGGGGAVTVSASATNPDDSVQLKTYVVDGGQAGGASVISGGFGTPQFTLTPKDSKSLLLQGVYNVQSGTALIPSSNVTTDDSGTSSSTLAWMDGHYTGTVTANTGVTLGGTDDNQWNAWSGYEVEPAVAGTSPAIDATTPAAVTGSSTSATTGSFSPPAGSLLVAVVQSMGTAAQAVSMSNTGQALTWTQVGTTYSVGYEGTEAVFIAQVPGSGQQAPVVTDSAATGVSSSGATLNGTVNPEGADASYKFDYGTSTSYGSTTTQGDAGAGTSAVNESANLTGLSPSTTYHYRIEATNSGGTSYGSDQTFTTPAAGGSGTVAYDATGPSSAGQKCANCTSLSWSHTVGSGSDPALVVGVGVGSSADNSCSVSVKDGSTAMTSLGTVHTDNQHSGFEQVFGLAGPPSGANAISVTVTGCGTLVELTGGSVSFTGVNQSAPFGTAVTGYGSSATPQVTVTTASSSDKLAAFAANGSAISSATSPGTSRYIANEDSNSGAGNSAGQTLAATGAAQTAKWSATSDWWGVLGVEVLHD